MKDFQQMTTTEIKDRGNAYFAKKQYESAIDCYNKAIVSDESHTWITCSLFIYDFICAFVYDLFIH
jgi:tetratricopeptide (TPR) repeat protein